MKVTTFLGIRTESFKGPQNVQPTFFKTLQALKPTLSLHSLIRWPLRSAVPTFGLRICALCILESCAHARAVIASLIVNNVPVLNVKSTRHVIRGHFGVVDNFPYGVEGTDSWGIFEVPPIAMLGDSVSRLHRRNGSNSAY